MLKRPDGSSELVVRADYLLNPQSPITGRGITPDVVMPPDATPDQVQEKAVALLKAAARQP
jgi:hypothetical protein